MPRVLPVVLAVALWIYGVIDCAQTPRHRMPAGLSKPVWLGITILVPAIGALAWLVISRLAQADGGTKLPKRRPKGPTAPDDDPEFLANLDWQARKAHYQRQKAEREQAARDAAAAQAAAASGGPLDAAREQPQVVWGADEPVPAQADAPFADEPPAGEAAASPVEGSPAAGEDASEGDAAPRDDAAEDTPAPPARPRSIEEELAELEAQFDDDGEDPPAR